MSNGENKNNDQGSYIILDGEKRDLLRHPTDFSVEASLSDVQRLLPDLGGSRVRQLSIGMSRVAAIEPERIDKTMETVRESNVAHHIYKLADTGEDIIITDRIFLRLQDVDPADLAGCIAQHNLIFAILIEHKLILEKRAGNRCTFKVTDDSGRNPLKIANDLATREGIRSCVPELLLKIKFGSLCAVPVAPGVPATGQHSLFKNQWHLRARGAVGSPLLSTASINAVEAWEAACGFGKSEIVIAVIDDGFDLPEEAKPESRHPAFKGTNVDTEHMRNLDIPGLEIKCDDEVGEDRDIVSRGGDFHGTCVASIIVASEASMLGVAPCCTFLPIRIGAIEALKPCMLLKALRHASQFADVVNCSFAMEPYSYGTDNLDPDFLPGILELIKDGGKRKTGLIIVIAAGNDDAPIQMTEEENTNGIVFLQGIEKITIGPKKPVHCGYAEIDGLVVVGASTSIKRKAAYSNWGEQITLVAPSDNGHELTEQVLKRTDPGFPAAFPGLGIVAAVNRALSGSSLPSERPSFEVPLPPPDDEESNPYSLNFGGTSAAAAIVSGVIGLMLSVNKDLTREQVIKILVDTAEKDLDSKTLDLKGDPNLIGQNGDFDAKEHSKFFGAGKINAAAAVEAAR